MNPFDNIRIVLMQTSHPGNIGAAARAMKTMGLTQLVLVKPDCFPDGKATALAAGADDLLATATVVDDLSTAIKGCRLVIGTSARPREIQLPGLNARECGEKTAAAAHQAPVAILFGREEAGLTSADLRRCHYHVMIPGNPEYSVLNLAAAVQIISYEIRMHLARDVQFPERPQDNYAKAEDVERFYQHMERVLLKTGFLKASKPKLLMPRLKRLFQRIYLEEKEVRMLRGILTSIERQ
jgi:tRNA (cytidine32/uridine32-2'-O)-methyltransferase